MRVEWLVGLCPGTQTGEVIEENSTVGFTEPKICSLGG